MLRRVAHMIAPHQLVPTVHVDMVLVTVMALAAFAGLSSQPAAPSSSIRAFSSAAVALFGYRHPATLPAGPFLAYDRDGKLAATIYMPPLSIMTGEYTFDNLNSSGAMVDHVDMYYNGGHPGVEEPHYHIVLWHIPADQEASLQ